MDLTKNCALCGGLLEYHNKHDPRFNPDGTYNGERESSLAADIEEATIVCTCESRALKGHCGTCRSCMIAMHGCACDGAFDAGCFNCTPREFERPSCPKENFAA